jgi:NAD(P)-dependent dehydrogenase (short-subunit alcohol dehydrogenase family)
LPFLRGFLALIKYQQKEMTLAKTTKPTQIQQQSSRGKSDMMQQKHIDELKDTLTAQKSGKLCNKVALIVGGDSGIGRAVAIAFAKEEADIAIIYRNASEEAKKTQTMVEEEGRSCLLIGGDVEDEQFCQQAVQKAIDQFGKIDILVNNAAEQQSSKSPENISIDELERTLQSNLCPMFFMTNAALSYLKEGSTIINTTSVTASQGNQQSLNYTSNKGAILTFTRSLSQSLQDKGIRVNGVAPGPVWTMLVPSNLSADKVKSIGDQMPMGVESHPEEIAQSVVFLASEEASYMAGQVLFTQSIPC